MKRGVEGPEDTISAQRSALSGQLWEEELFLLANVKAPVEGVSLKDIKEVHPFSYDGTLGAFPAPIGSYYTERAACRRQRDWL